MANTPRTGMPEIVESQSLKYLTHNTALRVLDGIVQATAISKSLGTPPVSPVDGDVYIVPSGATDTWAGMDGLIAYFQSSAWVFITPLEGWQVYVLDEGATFICDGASEPGWETFVDRAYDTAFFFSGTPAAGQVVWMCPLPHGVRYTVDLAGSYARCGTPPAGDVTFSVQLDGVEIATMTFPTGSGTGAFTTVVSGEPSASAGGYLAVIAPNPTDTTIADIGVCLVGRRES